MKTKEAKEINSRLDSLDGVFEDFHKLLNNHMTEYTHSFTTLKTAVETAIGNMKELSKTRDKSIHDKIDSFRWALAVMATIMACAVGGLIAIAIFLLRAAGN